MKRNHRMIVFSTGRAWSKPSAWASARQDAHTRYTRSVSWAALRTWREPVARAVEQEHVDATGIVPTGWPRRY